MFDYLYEEGILEEEDVILTAKRFPLLSVTFNDKKTENRINSWRTEILSSAEVVTKLMSVVEVEEYLGERYSGEHIENKCSIPSYDFNKSFYVTDE